MQVSNSVLKSLGFGLGALVSGLGGQVLGLVTSLLGRTYAPMRQTRIV